MANPASLASSLDASGNRYGCRKRRGTGHPNMSQGDEERFLLIQRDDVAHDSTLIAGIRQV